MKRKTVLLLVITTVVILVSPLIIDKGTGTVEESVISELDLARNEVVEKWETAAGEIGTARYIENIYKQYPNDSAISNIYYYVVSRECYDHYESLGDEKYLSQAIEYAEKIDENYSGVLSSEIHEFVDVLIPTGVSQDTFEAAIEKEDRYSSLTNSEKKVICAYIQRRYDYYDRLEGGYSGDKYSDIIMEEAAEEYGLTETQIFIIWANAYEY